MSERTSLHVDDETSKNLGVLADYESRSKSDEIRFLVSRRMKELKIIKEVAV